MKIAIGFWSSGKNNIKYFIPLQKSLFFLIIFFISSQVGLHFWPSFAYINGVRIDYLSPTLYFLDILVVLFILLSLHKINYKFSIQEPWIKIIIVLFLLTLIANIFMAKSAGSHAFGILKTVEFILFGIVVAKTFDKTYMPGFVRTISISAILSSVLAIWQFLNQSSVGGLWYFLGERTFNISTIGISTVNFDQQLLRAYGAFPHPNVLSFFLVFAISQVIFRIQYEKETLWKIILAISVISGTIGILLTFSRSSILLLFSLVLYAIYAKGKRNVKIFVPGIVALIGILVLGYFVKYQPEFIFRGIDFRNELFIQSFKIFAENPYFGIGLNNFFIHQTFLISDISPTNFQPPHNIFLIALLSLGIFGWWILPSILISTVRLVIDRIKVFRGEVRSFYQGILFILLSIIFVGMSDHFLITLEQGQVIIALILGLAFTKFK